MCGRVEFSTIPTHTHTHTNTSPTLAYPHAHHPQVWCGPPPTQAAGFTAMPHVEELHITADHVALDPDFFGPLVDLPLHVAFSLSP